MIIWTIYKIKNRVNNKQYVGQTRNTIEKRFKQHSECNSYIGKAIRKYGVDSFELIGLCSCFSQEEANKMEEYFVTKYDCYGNQGYNLSPSGRGTYNDKYVEKGVCINKISELSLMSRTELGYLFDILLSIGKNNTIKYGDNCQQYCRDWKDLSKVLNVSYETIRKPLIKKLKKFNLLYLENGCLYVNSALAHYTAKERILG